MVICLERGADLHTAQLMPQPLTVSCFSKIQIGFTFLVPAHLGSPGKRAVKWVCVTSQMHGGTGGGVCSLFERRSHAISLTVRNSGRSGAFATCRGTLILLYRPYPLLNAILAHLLLLLTPAHSVRSRFLAHKITVTITIVPYLCQLIFAAIL